MIRTRVFNTFILQSTRTTRCTGGVSKRFLTTSEAIIQPWKVINKKPNLNMSISERAAERLEEIYNDSKEILKIGVESGGCHGYQYVLKLIPELTEGTNTCLQGKMEDTDEFEHNDIDSIKDSIIFVLPEEKGKVLIDEKSLKILNDTTLTYTTELIGSTFKIINGHLKSSCGCGSSFDIDIDLSK
ncbi:hypothetical protein NCAS_0A11150 [Naumovozyma castellii]|uniref:Uncharacterized protein n=1 Tax=Naumovozyma castellii TaxID=27288 RepID=G0V875_NAUCA|nr:hypothetical protein NCAS_0A11150 [Naumovozyma castellii CBS 4309]CCC67673.1 hypothetical protein NCAS_0A11150 [Naumovozyma castellii CBS 4309]